MRYTKIQNYLTRSTRHAHELLTDFWTKKDSLLSISTLELRLLSDGAWRPTCVIREYDALPGIGHACGHNLIAEAGIAAGLGLKEALESSGATKARVTVMGTPGEVKHDGIPGRCIQ